MGGGQPSYTNIEKRMISEPGSCIAQARMPDGIEVLQDMKTWVRAQADAWIVHIPDGQDGRIPASRRFAWRLIPRPTREVEQIVKSPRFEAETDTILRWTAEELLYAERMRLETSDKRQHAGVLAGLPLA